MHKILSYLPFFVEVANRKSFTLAAEALEVPLPTLSRRIAALEKALGAQLLFRNTRNVELTESGKGFCKSCEYILEELHEAQEKLVLEQQLPQGSVRLSVPADLYFLFFRGCLSSFASKYPDIELNVYFNTRWVDLHSEPYDLDIRVGELPSSDLKVRKLATLRPALYASPKLLHSYPAPQTPADLNKLPFVALARPNRNSLILQRDGVTEKLSLRPAHIVNSMGSGLELVLDGHGFMELELTMGKYFMAAGLLIPLLPDWHGEPAKLSLTMPPGRLPHRVRLFADHLFEHFNNRKREFIPPMRT